MDKYIKYIATLGILFLFTDTLAQSTLKEPSSSVSGLFAETDPLPIKLSYSIKDLKKDTNDSTYVEAELSYLSQNNAWQKINTRIRCRGKYRLKNCYFPPLKMKIKKSIAKGTTFEGHKNLKIVQPCLMQKSQNDNVIKEYLAYKLYEIISPYHFRTRLISIDYDQIRGKKNKNHKLTGFFIEDDKTVAKRINAKVYDRNVHPLMQDDLTSIRHDMFQFMIGNTDYSQAYRHNVKLVFLDQKFISIPYDFDMSGFVNATYAVVSQINGNSLQITAVTDRVFRGFKRDRSVYDQVRKEFIDYKSEILSLVNQYENHFENSKDYEIAKEFIISFYNILGNDSKFQDYIIDAARE